MTDMGAQDAAITAIRARWDAVPGGPWRWDAVPEGVIRVWFPEPHDLTIACLIFPGDMATYAGPDLRLADAVARAPADVATLLAALDAAEARVVAVVPLLQELYRVVHAGQFGIPPEETTRLQALIRDALAGQRTGGVDGEEERDA